jgi:hypothetical protein
MKKKQSMSAKVLEPEEWNFSSLQSAQVESCYLYEYGREMTRQWPRLLQLFRALEQRSGLPREHPKWWKEPLTYRLIHRAFSRRFQGVFPAVSFEFFPHIPWQALNDTRRSAMMEDVTELRDSHNHRLDRLSIQTLRGLEAANVTSIEGFAYLRELFSNHELDQTEYGFFAINWNYGNPEIIDAFTSWLQEQRQQREKLGLKAMKYRKTSRGGFGDKLRWLGALRIVNHYSPSELSDYPCIDNPNKKLKVPAPYSHLPDLYEAAKKAQSLVGRIRATRRVKPVKGQSLRGNLEAVRKLCFPESA